MEQRAAFGRCAIKAVGFFLADENGSLAFPPAVYIIIDNHAVVNPRIYSMDFRTATDRVSGCISHADIAEAAGISIQSIRQARLDPGTPSYRSPPPGWQAILARLALERGGALYAFADELDSK